MLLCGSKIRNKDLVFLYSCSSRENLRKEITPLHLTNSEKGEPGVGLRLICWDIFHYFSIKSYIVDGWKIRHAEAILEDAYNI